MSDDTGPPSLDLRDFQLKAEQRTTIDSWHDGGVKQHGRHWPHPLLERGGRGPLGGVVGYSCFVSSYWSMTPLPPQLLPPYRPLLRLTHNSKGAWLDGRGCLHGYFQCCHCFGAEFAAEQSSNYLRKNCVRLVHWHPRSGVQGVFAPLLREDLDEPLDVDEDDDDGGEGADTG